MSAAELRARAHERAFDEHIYIRAAPNRPGYYTTRSRTDPRRRYTIVAIGNDVACSCRGFAYRRHCKHVEALCNRFAREGRPVPGLQPMLAGLPAAAADAA